MILTGLCPPFIIKRECSIANLKHMESFLFMKGCWNPEDIKGRLKRLMGSINAGCGWRNPRIQLSQPYKSDSPAALPVAEEETVEPPHIVGNHDLGVAQLHRNAPGRTILQILVLSSGDSDRPFSHSVYPY
ncbi:hypothetical protein JRQ81_001751 [Phrynocephalus forsythii]|uniref:Uncharacterized protein n=1 Tax=Phrynocephalus forsythii TaxID=171643 RepID=A0A9Q0Y9G9_9SAUR|nr:hypothetical protein JRQ81_001751 [Phrynocephalus forsythii]